MLDKSVTERMLKIVDVATRRRAVRRLRVDLMSLVAAAQQRGEVDPALERGARKLVGP